MAENFFRKNKEKAMLQSIKILSVLFISLVVVACSSGTIVKTYEGDSMAKEQVAVLTAPENISLISVNGKKVPKYLLSSINVNYGLKPGTNVVVFGYESVWAIPGKTEDGQRSELAESGPKEVVIDAVAGAQYNFQFTEAENIREARELAQNFKAEIVDANKTIVASSTDTGVYAPPVEKSANAILSRVAADSGSADDSSNKLPTLEGLKVLWKNASADDKKEFLKWAFE